MFESEDENYLRMAQKELDLGYFESAISFYDKAIKCSPNADNYYLKGLAYYNHCTKNYLDYSEASDIKSAIQNFSTAISIAPQNAIYYYYRARANLKYIQNYDYIEVDGDRGSTHDYKLKGEAVGFILADLQKAMSLDSAYEEEYKRFYNNNVEQKFILEDHSIPKKYQLDLNKKPNDKTIENPMNVYAKILSANSDDEQFLQAILTNNTSIVKSFIERGANVNLIDTSTGMSVLMLAAQKHNYKLCELLLDYGADLYWKNNVGETIFDVYKDDTKLISWLEAQNKRLKNQKFKDAALKGDISYITEHFSEVNTDTVSWGFVHTPSIIVLDYLLKKGIDINVQSIFLQKYGPVGKYQYALTSLMEGCQQNNFDKVEWLLEHGANADMTCQYIRIVHYKNDDIDEREELSALDYARANNNQKIIDLLLQYIKENSNSQKPQKKIISANPDEVKKLNRNPNNKEYKIVKTNEETNICIITDKYLNYGLSDKDLNIVLPAEYMNIQFCKDGDTNILLTKKDENGMPKYGIANKEGKIIIEPKYASIRRSLKYPDKYEINYGETFDKDSQLPFLVDIKTGEFYMEISDYEKYADQVAEDSYEVVEVFDYKTFALDLSQQSRKLVPEEIKGEDRVYIIEKIEEYANLAGEALYNDENINYNINEYKFLTQVIAEWTFHKSVDLIKGGIDGENRDYVLQKIAYTIFEVVKECIKRGIEWQTTVDTVEHHVNKVYQEVLNELYSEGRISLETYNNSIGNSNIDVWSEEQNEDHGSFYSTDENADSNYLKDKALFIYGKELAYKYLVKAAHLLKRHNCNKKDRQKIIKFLHECSEYYVNSAVNADFKFDKPEMERLLTVGMEVAFHRIVVMYKNNILNNPTYAESIIDTFASMVYAVEMNYIKDKDRLKDEYHIAVTIYFNELKNELKEWLEDGKITKEQYNHALDKSGLVYLTPEITRLMKSDPFKFSRMGYIVLFLVVWIIFKLIIFYTKHH